MMGQQLRAFITSVLSNWEITYEFVNVMGVEWMSVMVVVCVCFLNSVVMNIISISLFCSAPEPPEGC